MTILSKLINHRPSRMMSPGLVWSRMFRWDAKPDNVQAHSFGSGLKAPAHWSYVILTGMFIGMTLDWKMIREKVGIRIPNIWVQDTIEYFTGGEKRPQGNAVPSSLAADVYDKYGPEGVDAMVKAWENQTDKTSQPDMNAIHAVMMAQAAARYKDDVKEDAAALGLEKDKDTIDMIDTKAGSVKEILTNKLSVKAEEAVADAQDTENKEKIGFRDRKIIEYENRIRQYSAPDKESFHKS